MQHRLTLFLLGQCLVLGLYAQERDSNFFVEHITRQDGLSSREVHCIYRDSRGFLWAGTANGLDQYDGRTVTVFRHSRLDSASLPDNHIWSITEDKQGYLWVGTDGGICRFNPFNHVCVTYNRFGDSVINPELTYNCRLFLDAGGELWACTAGGLLQYDEREDRFKVLSDRRGYLHHRYIRNIMEESPGVYWLGTAKGVIRWDRRTDSASLWLLGTGAGDNLVTSLLKDHRGRILAGSWGKGLCVWDPQQRVMTSYTWEYTEAPTNNRIVMDLRETTASDGTFTLWMSTSEGLMRINLPDKLQAGMLQRIHPLSGVRGCGALASDGEGIVWIGDENGLCKFIRRNQYFLRVAAPPGDPSRMVTDTTGGRRGLLLASWYGRGLTAFDEHFHQTRSWPRLPPDAAARDNGQVSDVIRASDGVLWVATFNGLCRYDERREQYTWYRHRKDDPASLAEDRLTAVAQDDRGKIWVGTYARGVDVYDPVTQAFTHFVHDAGDPGSLCFNRIWAFYKDAGGTLWICTNDGLSRYLPATRSFVTYDQRSPQGLGMAVNNAVSDRKGILWLSTSKGLARLDPISGRLHVFASDEGMGEDNIRCVMNDLAGAVWILTEKGLSRFDPQTKTFQTFGTKNGLPDLSNGSLARDWDGDILVGSPGSMIRFSPAALAVRTPAPPVYITGVRVGEQARTFDRPLERLSIDYHHNSVSFTFSAPEFFNTGPVNYTYTMEGLENTWSRPDPNNTVNYGRLPPGTYRFRVKAAGDEGQGASVIVRVTPAYWQTWWFRLAGGCMLLLLTYGLFVHRIRGIRQQEALKTALNRQISDMRLKVLRTQMNPHFLFNALNSIQECIYTGQTEAASRYLSKFSRLVRLILEQSEHSFITIDRECAFLELYLEVEKLRFQDSFHYAISLEDPDMAYLRIPPMIVQPFVENALWHGLASRAGEKVLQVRFRADERFVYITVTDNGVGRAEAARKERDPEARTSMGVRITEEQLEVLGQLSGEKAEIRIEDLLDADGRSAGTAVHLSVPTYQSADGFGQNRSRGLPKTP